MQHSWPGNIRELENVLERSVNVLDGQTIKTIHLLLYLREQAKEPDQIKKAAPKDNCVECDSLPLLPLKETLAMAEKKAMEKALEAAGGNKLDAAKLLGVSKTNFYEKCRAYSI